MEEEIMGKSKPNIFSAIGWMIIIFAFFSFFYILFGFLHAEIPGYHKEPKPVPMVEVKNR